jgi:iron complex transport system substrate-binding protein
VPSDVKACLLLVGLTATLLLTACGERPEPLGELEQGYPVTVQGAGDQPTALEAQPERIVALDPGAAELVIALGAGDRLVGIPAGVPTGDGPREAPESAAEVVSANRRVQVDDVIALHPDLIVAAPTTDQLDVSKIGRETGAPVYVQPGSSVEEILRATHELGFLVGEPVEARTVASRIRSEVAAVEERIADEPLTTAFVDTGFFVTAPPRSLLGDLVSRARGENVAAETAGIEPFPVNRLLRLDPETYLATSDSQVTLKDLRRDPKTAKLTAVKNGDFRILPSDLVQRSGPYVAQALERVARALHPDAFQDHG